MIAETGTRTPACTHRLHGAPIRRARPGAMPCVMELERLVADYSQGRIGRRQLLQRGAALGLTATTLTSVLSACSISETAAGGGNLHLAPGNVVTLDPAFVDGETDIAGAVYEGLIAFKAGTYDTVNQLAESIEASEDGRTVRFTLKQGIQFHHGYGEVTAEDVKFSFERIAGLTKPQVASYYRDDWQALDNVEVTGKYEGVIHLKKPFAPLFTTTLPGTAGWVISKQAYEKLGPKKFKLHPVGTGKYQFKEVIPQQRSVLERFPGYSGASDEAYGPGKAAFKLLTFVYITGNQTLDAAMETGELEYIDGSKLEWEHLRKDKRFKGEDHHNSELTFIGLNTALPELSDINVRRAIINAIDRRTLIEVAFNEDPAKALAHGFVSPVLGLGYWKDAPTYEQDLDAAREYMAKAGKDSLTIPFSYNPDPLGANVGELIQGDLSKIGIKLVLKPDIAFGNPGKQLRKNGVVFSAYGLVGPDPAWLYVWFTCRQLDQYNYMYWCDPRFTKLYDESVTVLDRDRRQELFVKMAEMIYDAAIVIPLGWGGNFGIGNSTVVKPAWQPGGRPLYAAFQAV